MKVSLLLASMTLVACDVPTQVIVHLDADDDVRAGAATLTVRVCDTESMTVIDRSVALDATATSCGDRGEAPDGRVWWPACVPLSPRGGVDRSFGLIAELRDAAGTLTHVTRVGGGYVNGERIDVHERFDAECAGIFCDATETCRGGECVTAANEAVLAGCVPRQGGDGGVDAGPSIDAPALLFPWNGTFTGSVHAPTRSLRPTFSWATVANASSYEIELTSACDVREAPLSSCAFDEGVLRQTTATTRFTPTSPLEVSMSAPVGRRYYWRVRACDETCSPWSDVRYLDVGRLGNDFDGDGYSDLLVSAPRVDGRRGRIYFYRGSEDGLGPSATITPSAARVDPNSWLGAAVASLGDINGDGYADAGVGANAAFERSEGVVFIYLGGPGGIVTTAARENVLRGPQESSPLPDQADELFGSKIAGLGDTNADGFADIVIGARHYDGNGGASLVRDEGRAFFYPGSRSSVAALPDVVFRSGHSQANLRFGSSLAGAGDINGDGLFDLAVATEYADVQSPDGGFIADEGSVYVFLAPFTSDAENVRLISGLYQSAPEPGASLHVAFGAGLAGAGDLNGDGYGDLLVGAPNATAPDEAMRGGIAYRFDGGDSGIATMASAQLPNPRRDDDADFGSSVGMVGDLNGDGYAEIAVGDVGRGTPTGEVYLYYGSDAGLGPTTTLANPSMVRGGSFGSLVGGAGDLNGDGYDDLIVCARLERRDGTTNEGMAYIYYGSESGVSTTPDIALEPPDPSTVEGGYFGQEVSLMVPSGPTPPS